jgi:hypothetical protein
MILVRTIILVASDPDIDCTVEFDGKGLQHCWYRRPDGVNFHFSANKYDQVDQVELEMPHDDWVSLHEEGRRQWTSHNTNMIAYGLLT